VVMQLAATKIREFSEQMRPDTAVIISPTQTSDGSGGYTETWAVTGTYSCRVTVLSRSLGVSENVIAEKLRGRMGYEFFFPSTAVVSVRDRIVMNAQQYNIIAFLTPYSYAPEIRVLVVIAGEEVAYTDGEEV